MYNNRSNFVLNEHDISQRLQKFYSDNPYGERRYPGVTRVLSETKSEEDKKFLEEWRARVGEAEADRILKESMDIGNSLDSMIEDYLTKPNMNLQLYFKESGMKLFYQLKFGLDKIKPIGTQIHLYSDKYKVQGYLDCIGIINGRVTMIDFKNSRRKKELSHVTDYFLQATMYCLILYEMTGIIIHDISIMIGVRNDNVPQIFKAKTKDYIVQAKERLNQYRIKKESNIINTITDNKQ